MTSYPVPLANPSQQLIYHPLPHFEHTKTTASKETTPEEANKEDSLDKLSTNSACDIIFKGKSYQYRNVYKSIIRNMYSYFKNNKEDIIKILKEAGYKNEKVEHAFFKITLYCDNERKKGNKKLSQILIKKMLSERCIYTYIIREALNAMLKNQEEGKLGRVTKKNIAVYTEVCHLCYDEAVRILSQPAQGTTYKL